MGKPFDALAHGVRDVGRGIRKFGSSIDDEIHRIGRDIDKGTFGELKKGIQNLVPEFPTLDLPEQQAQINTASIIAAERDRSIRRRSSRTSNILARGTLG